MVAPTRERRAAPTPLLKTLATLDAMPPSNDEVVALKAIMRGLATPGQQQIAMGYIVGQLCGAGRVAFGGEKGVFLNGARAVSVAISQIADGAYLRFPRPGE